MNRNYMLLLGILCVFCSYIAYVNLLPGPAGELKVYIDDEVYLDSQFNEKFDYSVFFSKKVIFWEEEGARHVYIPRFKPSGQNIIEFKDFEDVWSFLVMNVSLPRVVVYFARWLYLQSYEELVNELKSMNYTFSYFNDLPVIKLNLGAPPKTPGYVRYEICKYSYDRIHIVRYIYIGGKYCSTLTIVIDPPIGGIYRVYLSKTL